MFADIMTPLEALGVEITTEPARAVRLLAERGLAFLFAPAFHPAMRHVGPVRRELGVPTVMNLVGPLANPAGVRRQVIGVADADRAPVVADALARLTTEHALVVHGAVGMDEIAPQGTTSVWEIRGSEVATWEIDPRSVELEIVDLLALAGGEPQENAKRIERLLAEPNADPSGRAVVALNAGAALYVAGVAGSYAEGVAGALEVLDDGRAAGALQTVRGTTSG
jgi:anthranilate phosphoribosyltransferase